MKPADIFLMIKKASYTKTGDDVDWTITEADGRTWLLFEESTTKRDWIINFNFPRKLYKFQKHPLLIHGGYGKSWKSANDTIMAEATKHEDLIIAGWSFGGAMAVLAAEDYYYRTGRKATVVTFGAPKVAGCKRTADFLRSCGDFTQYADECDAIPLLPPFPGYHQINKTKVGGPFCILKWKDAEYYHCNYDKEEYGDKDI